MLANQKPEEKRENCTLLGNNNDYKNGAVQWTDKKKENALLECAVSQR